LLNTGEVTIEGAVDNFNEEVIRFIYNFYVIKKQRPALKSLLSLVRELTTFQGGRTSRKSS
jgi:hypothetical protein